MINSFDVEHRGRLAELLADGFSDWQIIVLTHDQQFFEHLSRRAPSWRKLGAHLVDHDSGPRTTRYETPASSAAARERLESGDIHGAAAKARRALEELLQEVCEALWAPLPSGAARRTTNGRSESCSRESGAPQRAIESLTGVAGAAPQEPGGGRRSDLNVEVHEAAAGPARAKWHPP